MCLDLWLAADKKTLLKTGYPFLNSFITCCSPMRWLQLIA
jgi:hypothetical protein